MALSVGKGIQFIHDNSLMLWASSKNLSRHLERLLSQVSDEKCSKGVVGGELL